MIKPIRGTWLEFHHFGLPEGKYFNPMIHEFDDFQWKEKVREIASLNMKYIVIMATAFTDEILKESYFPSSIYPYSKMIKAKEPIKAVLEEANLHGIKVFLSVGFYGPWMKTYDNMTKKEVFEKPIAGMKELYKLYGNNESFYGWYLPDELEINPYFNEEFIDYCNTYAKISRKINKDLKILIAPYGTCLLKVDEKYVEQLKRLDVDFIAYQDEVGVRKATVDQTSNFYKELKRAHDLANKSKLWADVELFEFEGDVYKSALLPTSIDRLKKQLEAISNYVDEILVFEYQGMMNKPGTYAFCGHPDSYRYYNEYKKLLDSINKEEKK